TLNVAASGGVSLSYQWYSNTTNSTSGGTLIPGATSATYAPPTDTAGTMYYYVVVTNTDSNATGNQVATVTSNVVAVNTKSANANLSALTLSSGTLSPVFDKNTQTYKVNVPYSTSSITITPTVEDTEKATVTVNGQPSPTVVSLTVGDNTIQVVVRADNDVTTKTYTVNVNRAKESSGGGGGYIPNPQPGGAEPIESPSSQLVISRVVENGEVIYRANITLENVQAIVRDLASQNERTARVIFPSEATRIESTLPRSAAEFLASNQTDVFVQTTLGNMLVPHTSLSGVTNDVFFRIVPVQRERQEAIQTNAVNNQQVQAFVPNRMTVTLLGNPVTIETNMQNRPVTITLPIPTDATDEQIAALFVYIEHSDGSTEVKRGRIVEFKPGVKGIAFDVQHFSTFSLLYPSDVQTEEVATKTVAPYIQGYPDGTFKPNAFVTRAQMATMLARFLTNGDIPQAEATFADTRNSDAKDAIEFVKQTGLFNGVTETTFDPNGSITRAQMASVVMRWIEKVCVQDDSKSYCQAAGQGKTFADVPSNHWAATAIEKISALGIMTGNSATTFNPNGSLTRAQAVKVLNQLFERPALKEMTTTTFKDVSLTHWAIGDIEAAATEMIVKK
ncbi:S-layer homology domain-containing protein, partial [Lysinibacillus sp. KU-BSD001]|uniref:S-layer homology domain-containing protein n=1 Tax=Lysinibacillus sp. KU-BSD001 TaxID=3141328 RepID=UPI0036EE26EA